MNIQIDSEYAIKSDSNNIMIAKTSGERDFIIGYYPDLESCLKGFLSMKIKQSSAETIKELTEELKSLQQAINSLVQPLKFKLVVEK